MSLCVIFFLVSQLVLLEWSKKLSNMPSNPRVAQAFLFTSHDSIDKTQIFHVDLMQSYFFCIFLFSSLYEISIGTWGMFLSRLITCYSVISVRDSWLFLVLDSFEILHSAFATVLQRAVTLTLMLSIHLSWSPISLLPPPFFPRFTPGELKSPSSMTAIG